MNTKKLYALAHAFEALGMSSEQAFEKAFNEYSAVRFAQKASERVVSDLAAAAGVACCEGAAA